MRRRCSAVRPSSTPPTMPTVALAIDAPTVLTASWLPLLELDLPLLEPDFERDADVVASDARLDAAALRELRLDPFEFPRVDLARLGVDLFELLRALELVRPRVVPLDVLRADARFDDPR